MKKEITDISIIVPAYNAEKSIKYCLDSLLKQTKEEIEIIVVNDGSTDNTESIIKKYKDKRLKYYKNENHGIGYTRNFGIDKSNSKYIMFVDSDDSLVDDACEILYKKIEFDKLDLVICDYFKVINGRFKKELLGDFKDTTLKETPELINKINLAPWNKLYKSSLIKDNNIRFVEDLKYEDAPFVSEAMDKAKKIGKINECLNCYFIHENSETTVRDKRCFDIIKITDKMRKYFKNKKYIEEELNKWTVRTLTNYTIQQRVQIDNRVANHFIDEAFKYLKENVKDYKNNKYYENRSTLKRIIEKNKLLTKIYCSLYRTKNNRR